LSYKLLVQLHVEPKEAACCSLLQLDLEQLYNSAYLKAMKLEPPYMPLQHEYDQLDILFFQSCHEWWEQSRNFYWE
jgi:hypothetical protein